MGKYDRWNAFFAGMESDEVVLTLEELEEALGSPLPPSARRYPTWWSSAQHHAKWAHHGFVASPRLGEGVVSFRRRPSSSPRSRPASRAALTTVLSGERLILLGCVAQKRNRPALAKDLYVSPLWEKRRAYAEASGQPWAILSAEHGLVQPDQVIAPYDRSMKPASALYRFAWSRSAADRVIELCRRLGIDAVELHAGSAYVEHGLISALEEAELLVSWPLRGMRIGEQLSWYDSVLGQESASNPAPGRSREPTSSVGKPPVIVEMREIGPFDYRWPDSTEHFDYGWEGVARIAGQRVSFRHGVGRRHAYGADRARTVTWLGGQPAVEGVAADDYARTRALLSLLKAPDGSMIRDRAQAPEGYSELQLVDHRSEIDAPYSRSGLAVKLRADDVSGWLRHAVLRRDSLHADAVAPSDADLRSEAVRYVPEAEALPTLAKRKIAEALVAFGQATTEQLRADGGEVEFTEDAAANAFLRESPFAFLVGVICDQGIKAERAWAIPKELHRRMGHLDPLRIVAEPEAVYRAFVEPTALHRYVNNVPAWVVSAADRVLTTYGGDAGAIWNDRPTAAELQDRLRAFDGIGQKKAAMAVEILERDLGVEIREMSGSDVAFDVHIRRVFHRTGLAEVDDMDHMVEVARRIYPERPGALDGPAWVVGRTWCRPSFPRCPSCVLSEVCAKRISYGDTVRGV